MKEKLSVEEFLLRHFGKNFLPGITDNKKKLDDVLTDLMGRGPDQRPWQGGTVGLIDGFCEKINEKDFDNKGISGFDELVRINAAVFNDEGSETIEALAESVRKYIKHIKAAEPYSDKEVSIPTQQLDALLQYESLCLTAYGRKKDPRYPVMALSWLLIGALVRTKITDISNVLETCRKELDWAEAGLIPGEQILGIQQAETGEEPLQRLCRKLREKLERDRDDHPSFKLMKESFGLDKELIPRGDLLIPVSSRRAELNDDTEIEKKPDAGSGKDATTLADYIRMSW